MKKNLKAIIFCGGEGARLRPITSNKPKPLINILGKTILERILENLVGVVKDVIIIIKYRKEEVIEKIGSNFKGINIEYHIQGEKKGTGGALMGISERIDKNSDYLMINGDTIFSKNDINSIIENDGYSALVKEVNTPENYGIFHHKDFFAFEVIEKPKENIGNLANLGLYKLSSKIFDINENIKLSPRGEYEITDSINNFLKEEKIKLVVSNNDFIDIGYPWQLVEVLEKLAYEIEEKNEGEIESNVFIKGKVFLGKGSILKSGTYIEGDVYIGENCVIGPNAYIRGNTQIGDNSKVGTFVELKNSYIGEHTKIPHLSYIGDSIVGDEVNIGCGFISTNLRHDGKNIKVMIKGELVDSQRRKLGAIIGNNAKIGAKNTAYPGRIINSDSITLPGEIIK